MPRMQKIAGAFLLFRATGNWSTDLSLVKLQVCTLLMRSNWYAFDHTKKITGNAFEGSKGPKKVTLFSEFVRISCTSGVFFFQTVLSNLTKTFTSFCCHCLKCCIFGRSDLTLESLENRPCRVTVEWLSSKKGVCCPLMHGAVWPVERCDRCQIWGGESRFGVFWGVFRLCLTSGQKKSHDARACSSVSQCVPVGSASVIGAFVEPAQRFPSLLPDPLPEQPMKCLVVRSQWNPCPYLYWPSISDCSNSNGAVKLGCDKQESMHKAHRDNSFASELEQLLDETQKGICAIVVWCTNLACWMLEVRISTFFCQQSGVLWGKSRIVKECWGKNFPFKWFCMGAASSEVKELAKTLYSSCWSFPTSFFL